MSKSGIFALDSGHVIGLETQRQWSERRDRAHHSSHFRGERRKDIDVTSCFAPLLCWVLSQWQPGEKKLALAMDATTLGQRFTVLAKACFRSRLCHSALPGKLSKQHLRARAVGATNNP